ncbi:hypothetical protein [Bradyrhizobium sp. WD16]|uniref:hypothetical protein n=1 Tax=Bradyrhizobium sp. WD16 TaxID=1521768 RepID=UPI0020A58B69|nr:hypothetical protein [Bradyrhizobium sp. WD16]
MLDVATSARKTTALEVDGTDQRPTRMVYVLPAALQRPRDLPIDNHLDSEGVTSKVYNCCY